MQQLLGEYPPGAPRTQAAWQLALAAEAMDDAAVHTIDAWCQRMLREHAFDSGSPFDDVLDVDETGMRREAALDYWRQQVYPLDDAALSQVLAVWPSAHALVSDAQRLLEQPLPDAAGQGTLAALIEEQSAQRRQLKLGWAERARQMEHWLDHLGPGSVVAKARLQSRHYKSWLAVLSAWADDPGAELLEMRIGAERLTPHGLADVLHPAVELPPHFAALAALVQALARLPSPTAARRAHAAVTISRRLAVMKARAGTFGFADMLNRLDAALDPACNSAAARLRARIREQFPVALIDEFQDTSPVQARIFDRLYGIADNDPATGLLLIGDPKQSIYGFRGADIHAYLAARRATEGRRYVLGVNHRSTAALVDAVNALFARADSQLEGAFMFRPAGAPPIDDPLPFEPVQAHGRKQQFVCSARADGPAALAFELDDRLLDAGSSQREFAARCAEHIVQLLNDERAGFRDHQSGAFTRLASADIAVLVRTRRQAADVRRELARRHVPSVYLSDGDSVFAGDEARDLLHWLRAVAAPGDSRLVRAALATAMLGLTIDELRQLAEDDAAYDSRATELRRLRAVWQQQGVLSMLRQTLHSIGAPARWLASDGRRDGERRLTNHLHLAELLQAASAQHPGEQSLIRWLSQQREALMVDGDERIVRLESDAELVKVVTVHKAKGLQYPLVFLPFACHFRAVRKSRDEIVVLHDAGGQRQAHLDPAPQQIEAAERERLREDLRLLYVATTRAEHHLWIGLAALKSGTSPRCVWHRSAIGYALSGARGHGGRGVAQPGRGPGAQQRSAHPRADAGAADRAIAVHHAAAACRAAAAACSSPLRCRLRPAVVDRQLLVAGAHARRAGVRRARPWHWPATTSTPRPAAHAPPTPPVAAAGEPWHVLTPGAGTGTVLHALLELVAAEGLDRIDDDDLRRQLLRRCQQHGLRRAGATTAGLAGRTAAHAAAAAGRRIGAGRSGAQRDGVLAAQRPAAEQPRRCLVPRPPSRRRAAPGAAATHPARHGDGLCRSGLRTPRALLGARLQDATGWRPTTRATTPTRWWRRWPRTATTRRRRCTWSHCTGCCANAWAVPTTRTSIWAARCSSSCAGCAARSAAACTCRHRRPCSTGWTRRWTAAPGHRDERACRGPDAHRQRHADAAAAGLRRAGPAAAARCRVRALRARPGAAERAGGGAGRGAAGPPGRAGACLPAARTAACAGHCAAG